MMLRRLSVAVSSILLSTCPLLGLAGGVRNGWSCWHPGLDNASAQNNDTISIDLSQTQVESWEGWGTSLAWWAQAFGGEAIADEIADVFFTRGWVNITTNMGTYNLPGLGMNIARYVAGASSFNTIGSGSGAAKMQESPHITDFKQQRAVWINWYSEDPDSDSWDWGADPNRTAMLMKAKERGVDRIELFSNSPVWWMCYNHNPSGAGTSGTDNLQAWNYQKHSVYLATIAGHFAKQGINFTSVEAFNEPIAGWWTRDGTQEGCHFDHSTQQTVIGYLREELDARGLNDFAVAASDENTYDEAIDTWQYFDGATKQKVGRVNVHGYQYADGSRDGLYTAANSSGKNIWMSEYTDADTDGLGMSWCLNLDFYNLRPTAWVYWQVLDSGGYGLIQSNPGYFEGHWIGPPNKKYHVLAHYSRHIRPGMSIVKAGDINTVAAIDRSSGKLVIVSVNYGAPRYVGWSIANTEYRYAGRVTRWQTNTQGGDSYVEYHDTVMHDGNKFWSWFDAATIQTFEVESTEVLAFV